MERAKHRSAVVMLDPYLDHPAEDALERFLLHQCEEEELELVETHILACESCVTRLETLELQITATKLALQQLENERITREAAKQRHSWKQWFTLPTLSWAAGAACLAVALLVAPKFVPTDVNLSAYRGLENPVVPEGRPLDLHLNTTDLSEGRVQVELVNGDGSELWKGTTEIKHDQAEVRVPKITESGAHFLRLYTPAQGNTDNTLLREFAFQVQ
jgi:anti-sigma factor RsiW